MTAETNLYEKLTLGVIKSLEKRPGICNIQAASKPPTDRPDVVSWEQKYSCMMPDDLRNFFLTSNGFQLTWSTKLNDHRIPVGHMAVNPLEKLIRIGAMGTSDPSTNLPSVADVELADYDEADQLAELPTPRFDHRSRIFELDSCNGCGKVCYVYRNTKPGIPAQKAEVWFLDRALRWHFLADTFINYFRMMLIHLGLPQWQYAFTDIGLSSQSKQWFHMYCPLRLGVDGKFYDSSPDSATPNPSSQLDVARVFKGKTDKKKTAVPQNVKKKPAVLSAKGSAPGRLGPVTAPTTKTFR